MLPQSSSALQPVRFGVGIDTSRYGHHACLLRHDLQPAGPEFAFAESAQGYQQLRLCLERVLGDAAGPISASASTPPGSMPTTCSTSSMA
jgi:hypothetical protein